jgi:hypothetical protein
MYFLVIDCEKSPFLLKANSGYNLEGKNPITFNHLLTFYGTMTKKGEQATNRWVEK